MSLDIMRGLLRDFGASIGLPDLEPDNDGYCCLRIGEQVTVSLQYEPEGQDLALFAKLCRIPQQFRFEAYEMMLAGNLFWAQTKGGTLAVEPSEGIVFLLMKEKLQAMDFSRFNALLQGFVEAAEDWQRRLEALSEELDEIGADAPVGGADYIRLA
jgi:hypothetical protein